MSRGGPLSVVAIRRPWAVVLLIVGALIVASAASVRPAEAAGSASISGVVTDRDGQPISGVTVKVGAGDYGADLSTDEEGRFVASGLPAGRYVVCFYADAQDLMRECWRDIEMGQGYTRVEVTDGEAVTGIDEILLPNSYLRGTVTDTRGAPVEGAGVSETWYAPDGSTHWSLDEPTRTAADGSFKIGPLSSGEHTLQFSDHALNRYASEWWDDAPTDAAATRIPVVRGESIDGLDAELADLAHITGRVKGVDGSSASGARVRVFKELIGSPDYIEMGSGSALTAGGRYEIALRPGTYRLAFDAAPGKYRTEYWKNARSVDTAHDVVITGTTPVTDLDAVLGLAPPSSSRVDRRSRAAPGSGSASRSATVRGMFLHSGSPTSGAPTARSFQGRPSSDSSSLQGCAASTSRFGSPPPRPLTNAHPAWP